MDPLEPYHRIKAGIIRDFSKAWEANDGAHRIGHFSNVEECGMIINSRLDLRFDGVLIMMVAFFHDMFAYSRDNHHHLSACWIETTSYPPVASLLDEDKRLVATACLQHRASFTGKFDNKFAELMNAADRELPCDVSKMIERAVQYRIGLGVKPEDALKPAIEHIKEKFGVGGYARYSPMYLEVFGDELAEQRRQIANL